MKGEGGWCISAAGAWFLCEKKYRRENKKEAEEQARARDGRIV